MNGASITRDSATPCRAVPGIVAEDRAGGELIGTVQLVLGLPENQPHRAEVAEMLVRRSARRQGLGGCLMRAAEEVVRAEAECCSCSEDSKFKRCVPAFRHLGPLNAADLAMGFGRADVGPLSRG
jgi:GNAT superfamily N-acetyltransferase